MEAQGGGRELLLCGVHYPGGGCLCSRLTRQREILVLRPGSLLIHPSPFNVLSARLYDVNHAPMIIDASVERISLSVPSSFVACIIFSITRPVVQSVDR